MGHPVDKLVASLFLAVLVTVVVMVLLPSIPLAHLDEGLGVRHVVVGMVVSALLVFPKPLLLRTVLRKRRSPFLFDEDLDNMLVGRAIGLLCGLMAGMWLLTKIGS